MNKKKLGTDLVRLNISVTVDMRCELKKQAAQQNISMRDFVLKVLHKALIKNL